MARPRGFMVAFWLLSSAALSLAWLVATERLSAQDVSNPAPEVEWRDIGEYAAIDQKGNGIQVMVPRKALASVVLVKKGTPYAVTVYRDDYDLVVLGVGATEWRVRCPDRETAVALAEFLLGEDIDGKSLP